MCMPTSLVPTSLWLGMRLYTNRQCVWVHGLTHGHSVCGVGGPWLVGG